MAKADAATLGDAWLAPAIQKGLIQPIPGAHGSAWWVRCLVSFAGLCSILLGASQTRLQAWLLILVMVPFAMGAILYCKATAANRCRAFASHEHGKMEKWKNGCRSICQNDGGSW